MIEVRLKISLALFIIFVSVLPLIVANSDANQVGVEDASRKVDDAFKVVIDAYDAGGDVKDLVSKLNQALDLISKARAADSEQARILAGQAYDIAAQVEGLAPGVKEEGIILRQAERNTWIMAAMGLAVGGLLTYFYGPRVYWSLWLRMRKNHIVRVNEGKRQIESQSMITSGEVWAVIIAVIVLVSVFAYTEFYYSRIVIEPFSELGILGPTMVIGDYPGNVTVGETIDLNIYVANHLGKPTYYEVMVKLREKDVALDPAPGGADRTFDCILLHEEERIIPFNMTIEKPGLNQRLIFELWTYNVTSSQIEYHDRWGWIWLNVTGT